MPAQCCGHPGKVWIAQRGIGDHDRSHGLAQSQRQAGRTPHYLTGNATAPQQRGGHVAIAPRMRKDQNVEAGLILKGRIHTGAARDTRAALGAVMSVGTPVSTPRSCSSG